MENYEDPKNVLLNTNLNFVDTPYLKEGDK